MTIQSLYHFNGTNGSQPTTGLDDTGTATTYTWIGSAQISTTQSVFGGASLWVNSGNLATNAAIDFTTNGFTVRFRYYPVSGDLAVDSTVRNIATVGSASFYTLNGHIHVTQWFIDTSAISIDFGAVTAGSFYAISFERFGNNFRGFLDGTRINSITNTKTSLMANNVGFGDAAAVSSVGGYIDEFVVDVGTSYAGDATSYTLETVEYGLIPPPPVLVPYGEGFGGGTLTTTVSIFSTGIVGEGFGGGTLTTTVSIFSTGIVGEGFGGGLAALTAPVITTASIYGALGLPFFIDSLATRGLGGGILRPTINFMTTTLVSNAHLEYNSAELPWMTQNASGLGAGRANTLSFISWDITSHAVIEDHGYAVGLRFFASDLVLSSSTRAEGNGYASLIFGMPVLSAAQGGGRTDALPFLAFDAQSQTLAFGSAPDLPFITFTVNSHATEDLHGYATNLPFITINASYAYAYLPFITFSVDASGSVLEGVHKAYVMNVETAESWRYTNYDFMHIIHIAGKPYGVTPTGLYLLEGAKHNGTVINGTIVTKEFDFMDDYTTGYQSKFVDNIWLNSDSTTHTTAFVDSKQSARFQSTFGGRKVQLARGLVGRYWQYKIEMITKLEGIELIPRLAQRRVK